MYILGLNIGHNSSACLLKDGKVIGCMEEERFSRQKGHAGIPFASIKYLLEIDGIKINDIDYIVSDGYYHPKLKDHDFAEHYLKQYKKRPLMKKVLSWINYNFPNAFENYFDLKWNLIKKGKKKKIQGEREQLAKIFGVSKEKVLIGNHQKAHALSGGFNIFKNKKTLVFTLDGEGEDAISASVNIFDGKTLKTISKSKKLASLGYLYSNATIYLGMKPGRHEFKVMGMAPYAKDHNIDKIYDKFDELIWVNDNLEFKSKFDMAISDRFFKKEMKYERFDVISGAVQRLVEKKISEWVFKAIKKTGIRDIAVGGGVFMNVKACMKLAQMPEVKSIFVMPSAGDESVCLGNCFYGYMVYCKKDNIKIDPKPLEDLYLGPEYEDQEVEELIENKNLKEKYKITKPKNINKEVARLLAKEEIVARCSGRSEWGARALGNRSILANPKSKDTIRTLNEAIKDRDFWMPFTPSMLDKFEKKYIVNPKKIIAPYMCITFESKEQARDDLPAALHPYDFTVRPQIVTKKYNKDYYELIEEFSKKTGTGAILNTSFNLHGEPNVLKPEDALHTVENSGLKYLAIGNYLFEKKEEKGKKEGKEKRDNKEKIVKEFYEKYPFPSDEVKSLEDLEKNKWILNTLKEKPNGKILDVGCGSGEEALFLSQFGEVTGIDFSEHSIEKAKKLAKKFNKKVRFFREDLLNPKHKEKYDYIFCIGVVHHIKDIDKAIENLKIFMKKDTHLVIAIGNKYGRGKPKKMENKVREIDSYSHPFTILHSRKEALERFRKHNFKIVRMWRNIPDIIRKITNKGSMMSFYLKLK
jgi:carbamoyltransferase